MSLALSLSPADRRVRLFALSLAVAAYLLAFFHRVAPAAVSHELSVAYQISAASLGFLAATYFWIYTAMQIPTGVLADTLGPRRVLVCGGIVAGVGSILFGLAPSFAMAAVGRALVGLGVSVAFIAMLKIIAVWFEERLFATLTGCCMLIGNFGSILAGAPLAWLTQLASWRSIFVGVGVLSMALAILSALFVRDQPDEAVRQQPEAERTTWLSGLLVVLRNRLTWPGFLVSFGIVGSVFAFAGLWAVPYFVQVHGMTRSVASNHISVYFIGFALGAFFVGTLSDRMRRRRPILNWCSAAYAASWLVWLWGVKMPAAASYAMCLSMGLLSAGVVLSWACAKEVNPPRLSGMATSVVNLGGFLGVAILQPLVGWVMDRNWTGAMTGGVRLYSEADYRTGLLLMFWCAVLSSVATLFVRETNCRNIWQDVAVKPRLTRHES